MPCFKIKKEILIDSLEPFMTAIVLCGLFAPSVPVTQ